MTAAEDDDRADHTLADASLGHDATERRTTGEGAIADTGTVLRAAQSVLSASRNAAATLSEEESAELDTVSRVFLDLSAAIDSVLEVEQTPTTRLMEAHLRALRAYILTPHLDETTKIALKQLISQSGHQLPDDDLLSLAWNDTTAAIAINRSLALRRGEPMARENLGQALNTMASLRGAYLADDFELLQQANAMAEDNIDRLEADWTFATRLAAKMARANAGFARDALAADEQLPDVKLIERSQRWIDRVIELAEHDGGMSGSDGLVWCLDAANFAVHVTAAVHQEALSRHPVTPSADEVAFWAALRAVIDVTNTAVRQSIRLIELGDVGAIGSDRNAVVEMLTSGLRSAILIAHDSVYGRVSPSEHVVTMFRYLLHQLDDAVWPREKDYRDVHRNMVAVITHRNDHALDVAELPVDYVLDFIEMRFVGSVHDHQIGDAADEPDVAVTVGDDEMTDEAIQAWWLPIAVTALLTANAQPPVPATYLMALVSNGSDLPEAATAALRGGIDRVRQVGTVTRQPGSAPDSVIATAQRLLDAVIDGDREFKDFANLLDAAEMTARRHPAIATALRGLLARAGDATRLDADECARWCSKHLTYTNIECVNKTASPADLLASALTLRRAIDDLPQERAQHHALESLESLYYEGIAQWVIAAQDGQPLPDHEGGRTLAAVERDFAELLARVPPTDEIAELAQRALLHFEDMHRRHGEVAPYEATTDTVALLPVRHLALNGPGGEFHATAVESIKLRIQQDLWYNNLPLSDLAALFYGPQPPLTPDESLDILELGFRATDPRLQPAVTAILRVARPIGRYAQDAAVAARLGALMEEIAGTLHEAVFANDTVDQDALHFYLQRASAALNWGAVNAAELAHRYLLSLEIYLAARAHGFADERLLAAYHCSELAREIGHLGVAAEWASEVRLLLDAGHLTAPEYEPQRRGIIADIDRTIANVGRRE